MAEQTTELKPGQQVPDFSLRALDGREVRAWSYRNRRNLIVVLIAGAECEPCRVLLVDLAHHRQQIDWDEGQVLSIVYGPREEAERLARPDGIDYPLLFDPDGKVFRALGAWTDAGPAAWTAYVTDRDGQIYASYQAGAGRSLPAVAELLEWLSYIAMQCPE